MIYDAIDASNLEVHPLPDSMYDFNDWVRRLQALVESQIKHRDVRVRLYGFEKDSSSFYLRYFPTWEFVAVPEYKTRGGARIDATAVRETIYSNAPDFDYLREVLHRSVADKVTELLFEDADRLIELKKDFEFCRDYKKQWAAAPYPPTFVTVDAIVYCRGHVLMIKRGRHPGKGLYALPGGFIGPDEYLLPAAIRELKEETRIDVSKEFLEYALKSVKVFDNPWRDPRGRMITHAHYFYLDSMVKYGRNDGLPAVRASDDAAEAEWISLNRLDKLASKMYSDHLMIVKNVLGAK